MYRRRSLAVAFSVALVIGVAYFGVHIPLQGSLLTQQQVAVLLKLRADRDGNGMLAPYEVRGTVAGIIRGVATGKSTEDINGDGSVDRVDIRAATQAFRGLLTSVCGNGNVDLGEDCDDGNTVDDASCPAMCMNARKTVVSMPVFLMNRGTGQWLWTHDQQDASYGGGGALNVDDPIDGQPLGDTISTSSTIMPYRPDCEGCGFNPIPPQTFIDLSRLPVRAKRVESTRLVLDAWRDSPDWFHPFHLQVFSSGGIVPLTGRVELPVLPRTGSRVTLSFPILPNVDIRLWRNPTLMIATDWSYCSMNTATWTCSGYTGMPPTTIVVDALHLETKIECDGACDSVAPQCGNGILERFAAEKCDDGNTTDDDACDHTCTPTGLWWIPELQTLAPHRLLASDMRVGLLDAESPDAGTLVWYEDLDVSGRGSIFVSRFSREQGWAPPLRLNPDREVASVGCGFLIGGGGRIPCLVLMRDGADRISFIFASDLGGMPMPGYRLTLYEPIGGTWSLPEPLYTFSAGLTPSRHEASRMDGDIGVMLFQMDSGSGTYIDSGLFARTYRSGVWGPQQFIMNYEDTEVGHNRVREAIRAVGSNVANVRHYIATHNAPPDSLARITSLSGETYTMLWYGTTRTITVP